MNILVACPACKRQFRVESTQAVSGLSCQCGALLHIPASIENPESRVVRCSACGGVRAEGSKSCQFCGADFTLREQDMNTLCSNCCNRVSDTAKFCQHCGHVLEAEVLSTTKTEASCPACIARNLSSRPLPDHDFSFMECQVCAGIWLGHRQFEILQDEASRHSVLPLTNSLKNRSSQVASPNSLSPGAFYRKCPSCQKIMNRKNFGSVSGIILDTCGEHGVWFDKEELGEVLEWISHGGLTKMNQYEKDEERDRRLTERRLLQIKLQSTSDPDLQRQLVADLNSLDSRPNPSGTALGEILKLIKGQKD